MKMTRESLFTHLLYPPDGKMSQMEVTAGEPETEGESKGEGEDEGEEGWPERHHQPLPSPLLFTSSCSVPSADNLMNVQRQRTSRRRKGVKRNREGEAEGPVPASSSSAYARSTLPSPPFTSSSLSSLSPASSSSSSSYFSEASFPTPSSSLLPFPLHPPSPASSVSCIKWIPTSDELKTHISPQSPFNQLDRLRLVHHSLPSNTLPASSSCSSLHLVASFPLTQHPLLSSCPSSSSISHQVAYLNIEPLHPPTRRSSPPSSPPSSSYYSSSIPDGREPQAERVTPSGSYLQTPNRWLQLCEWEPLLHEDQNGGKMVHTDPRVMMMQSSGPQGTRYEDDEGDRKETDDRSVTTASVPQNERTHMSPSNSTSPIQSLDFLGENPQTQFRSSSSKKDPSCSSSSTLSLCGHKIKSSSRVSSPSSSLESISLDPTAPHPHPFTLAHPETIHVPGERGISITLPTILSDPHSSFSTGESIRSQENVSSNLEKPFSCPKRESRTSPGDRTSFKSLPSHPAVEKGNKWLNRSLTPELHISSSSSSKPKTLCAAKKERITLSHRVLSTGSAFYQVHLMLSLICVTLIVGSQVPSVFAGFECLHRCDCYYKSNKLIAECGSRGLSRLPEESHEEKEKKIRADIQILNLTRNTFTDLKQNIFFNAKMANLQRIYLKQVGLERVDKAAFHPLTNLVELDMSCNLLKSIPSESFFSVPKLRDLDLSENQLSHLRSNSFTQLTSLKGLNLERNIIKILDIDCFNGLTALETLKLSDNQLSLIDGRVLLPLTRAHSLTLSGNHWNCDCRLRQLREYLLRSRRLSVYDEPKCTGSNKIWTQMDLNSFICSPRIVPNNSSPSIIQVEQGKSLNLECSFYVRESPELDNLPVRWLWQDRPIGNNSRGVVSNQLFHIREFEVPLIGNESTGKQMKVSRLEISLVLELNQGQYTCLSENGAGSVHHNFSVSVTGQKVVVGGGHSPSPNINPNSPNAEASIVGQNSGSPTSSSNSGSPSSSHPQDGVQNTNVHVDNDPNSSTEEDARSVAQGGPSMVFGLLLGILAGVSLVLVVFSFIVFVFCHQKRKRRDRIATIPFPSPLPPDAYDRDEDPYCDLGLDSATNLNSLHSLHSQYHQQHHLHMDLDLRGLNSPSPNLHQHHPLLSSHHHHHHHHHHQQDNNGSPTHRATMDSSGAIDPSMSVSISECELLKTPSTLSPHGLLTLSSSKRDSLINPIEKPPRIPTSFTGTSVNLSESPQVWLIKRSSLSQSDRMQNQENDTCCESSIPLLEYGDTGSNLTGSNINEPDLIHHPMNGTLFRNRFPPGADEQMTLHSDGTQV